MSEAKMMAEQHRAEAKELLKQAAKAKTQVEKDELMDRRDTVLQIAQSFDFTVAMQNAMKGSQENGKESE